MKVGYQGYFSDVHNGRVANDTQLRYTFNNQRADQPCSYFLAPRWDQHDRTETVGFFAQDQWTIGRLTLQGGVRYDRAWSWAPADGNGTTRHVALQPAADLVRPHGQRERLQRHHAAARRSPTTCSATARRRSRSTSASTSRRRPPTSSTAPTTRPRASSRASARAGSAARGWTDGNGNYVVDCDLLNPAAQNNLATGGDLCAALGGNNLNFGNANPNTTTDQPGHPRRLGRAAVRLAVRRRRCSRSSCRGCRSKSATTAGGGATSSSPTTR